MGKIEEKKREKKNKLLTAAFALFQEKGLEETSVSDITRRAGIAKGTFYLYFRDKYALYDLLVAAQSNDVFLRAYNSMLQSEIKDDEDMIFFLINHIIDQLADNPSLLMFITKNLSWGLFRNALLSSDTNEYIDFEKIFSSFIYKDGVPLYKDPDLMVYMIIELIGSTCYSVILESNPVTLEELKPYLFRCIHHILAEHRISDAPTTSTTDLSEALGLEVYTK